MAVGVLVAPELYDGQDEHVWREVYQFYGLLTGQDDWAADVTLKGYLYADGGARINGLEVTGDLHVHGHTTLGDNAVHTLVVAATSTFNAGVAINANATIGDNASRAITVNGTTTFNANVTDNNDLTVKGNTTLGDASSDAVAINGTATHFAPMAVQTSGGQVALHVNPSTPRVYVGANSDSGNTAGHVLDVSGGHSYFSDVGTQYAIGVKYSRAGQAYYVGASAATNPDLVFSNKDGAQAARLTNAGVLIVGTGPAPAYNETLRANRIFADNGYLTDGQVPFTLGNPQTVAAGARTQVGYFRLDLAGSVRYVPYYS